MIVKHLIILSSSYSTKRRIVLHFLGEQEESYRKAIDEVRQAYEGKDVRFSLHSIVTGSPEWDSVVERDPYFDDVYVVDTVEEFVELIRRDRYFSGSVVGSYILSVCPCTHTRLEKLAYYCYADYLCATGEKLFEDKIFAFDYGPVVESIYRQYSQESKDSPGSVIKHSGKPLDDDEVIQFGKQYKMPYRSRIIFAEDGLKKIESIDATLASLKDVSTAELVERTHRDGSPWSHTKPRKYHTEISDSSITAYHSIEL